MTRKIPTLELFWQSIALGVALTFASYACGIAFHWITSVDPLEAFAVFTSYSCTYLCVKESRINYPIGAISVAALGLLFYRQGLFASAALQLYLFPTLLYGWVRWRSDRDPRPVTRLAFNGWLIVYGALTASVYAALLWLDARLGATMSSMDTAILVLSILAQFLMDNKKIENWIVWLVVDVVSVYVYVEAGLFVVAFQMFLFLLNTAWGFWDWNKSRAAEAAYAT